MAVALVGSAGNARATTAAIVGAYGQAPTTGNLLVAVLTGSGGTVAAFTCAQTSGTTGWAELIPAVVDNNAGGTNHTGIDIWFKVAGASEPAPGFTLGVAGTICTDITIFELTGANTTTPYDSTAGVGTYQSSTPGLTSQPTMTPTTAGNPAAAGEFGISAFIIDQQANTTQVWTELGTGWTNAEQSGAVNQFAHTTVNYQAALATGTPVTDSGHYATGASGIFGSAVVVAIAVSAGASPTPATAAATGVPDSLDSKVSLNMTIQGV